VAIEKLERSWVKSTAAASCGSTNESGVGGAEMEEKSEKKGEE